MSIMDSIRVKQFTHTLNKNSESQVQDALVVVTLDKLRPNNINPRLKRNEKFLDIKASIKERGLDTPPTITKRPGEDFYVISDGGNTRLEILQELYKETQESRFFSIACRYKPWVSELNSLVGHLAENELRADYTFVEKARGVAKARVLYETEHNQALSLRELAERLKQDGYPIAVSHISKMEQTLRYLEPTIPQLLYNGLGRTQIEKILSLRSSSEKIWKKYHHNMVDGFDEFFNFVLGQFNIEPNPTYFDLEHLPSEIMGEMSQTLSVDYNMIALELDEKSLERQRIFGPTPDIILDSTPIVLNEPRKPKKTEEASSKQQLDIEQVLNSENDTTKNADLIGSNLNETSMSNQSVAGMDFDISDSRHPHNWDDLLKDSHNTDSDAVFDLRAKKLISFPLNNSPHQLAPSIEDGEPIVDIWRIHPMQSSAEQVRDMIFKISLDLTYQHPSLCRAIAKSESGIGFSFNLPIDKISDEAPETQELRQFLSFMVGQTEYCTLSSEWLFERFNDVTIVKLLRLIRLVRYIKILDSREFNS